ncbi:MAG: hypothetical protein HQ521_18630 [Bacteroidetes bacterium]|nr:hypothetical protein [Bacteroidota bacterium]
MKKVLSLAFLIGSAFLVSAQMTLSSGAQIVVASGSTLVVNDVVNTSGTIDNDGTVSVKGDVTNNSGGLFDSGSGGTVTFTGSSAQEVTGAATVHFYGTLDINNSNGVSITNTTTGAAQEVHGALSFTAGKLTLNNFDLTLGTADPTGTGASAYIVTNGTGQLKRVVAASDVIFPVGNSAYNPITLNNAGTSDTYGVKVVDSKPASFSGTTHIVNRSWDITEAVSDGSNYTATTQWNSGEEATFDRTRSSIGFTSDAGSNVSWGSVGAATGSDPYTQSQSGYTSIGTLMVGDYFYAGLVIDLKVVLAAAWNAGNDNMDKTLNTAGLIPLTDPYSLGTSVSSVPASAVDWVKVELRNSGNHATITNSYAKFVDVDGQIIEEDGSNMKLTGALTGSYYVAIQHRNHLGVVSNSTVDIGSTPIVNFTGAQATAWQDGTISTNAAMKEVETGVFGLWDGDATANGTIAYNGASNDRSAVLTQVGVSTPGNTVQDTYSANDVNMDGDVIYNGAGSDRSSILSVVGVSTPGVVYTGHVPEL